MRPARRRLREPLDERMQTDFEHPIEGPTVERGRDRRQARIPGAGDRRKHPLDQSKLPLGNRWRTAHEPFGKYGPERMGHDRGEREESPLAIEAVLQHQAKQVVVDIERGARNRHSCQERHPVGVIEQLVPDVPAGGFEFLLPGCMAKGP